MRKVRIPILSTITALAIATTVGTAHAQSCPPGLPSGPQNWHWLTPNPGQSTMTLAHFDLSNPTRAQIPAHTPTQAIAAIFPSRISNLIQNFSPYSPQNARVTSQERRTRNEFTLQIDTMNQSIPFNTNILVCPIDFTPANGPHSGRRCIGQRVWFLVNRNSDIRISQALSAMTIDFCASENGRNVYSLTQVLAGPRFNSRITFISPQTWGQSLSDLLTQQSGRIMQAFRVSYGTWINEQMRRRSQLVSPPQGSQTLDLNYFESTETSFAKEAQ